MGAATQSPERASRTRAEIAASGAEEIAKQLTRARIAGTKTVSKHGAGKSRRERDRAAADPAGYFNGEYERRVRELGHANILISC